jgi:hypothetical protein
MSFSLENYLWRCTPDSTFPGPVKIENDTREQRNGISSNLSGGEKKTISPLVE